MKQIGYLFTAGVTQSQMRPSPGLRGDKSLQTWDTCMSLIVYGGDAAIAQKAFEDWCQRLQEGEDPVQTEIKKIVGAEVIEQLLTESGDQPLDWPEISEKFMESLSAIETEAETITITGDLGEGYWVDIEQTVPPESARLDMESLKRGLGEDICSALNWSPDKKFLFLVSSLSAPSLVIEPNEEVEETDSNEAKEQDDSESRPVLDETVAHLPEMREKEAAALIEARNSVVAAWLWRKFAANTRLASNQILMNPCCGMMPAN
jgi:hypothetical protein